MLPLSARQYYEPLLQGTIYPRSHLFLLRMLLYASRRRLRRMPLPRLTFQRLFLRGRKARLGPPCDCAQVPSG